MSKFRWPIGPLFIGILGPLFLFGELAEEVVEKEPSSIDGSILNFLHVHATSTADSIMLLASAGGSGTILVPLNVALGLLLLYQKRNWALTFWSLSVVGAAALNLFAKQLFQRARPALWLSIAPEKTYSFPSGHAMQTMAFSVAICTLLWHTRWRWPVVAGCCVYVFTVGLSRVYLGVHYPSDIAAGWVASIAWVSGIRFSLLNRLSTKEQHH